MQWCFNFWESKCCLLAHTAKNVGKGTSVSHDWCGCLKSRYKSSTPTSQELRSSIFYCESACLSLVREAPFWNVLFLYWHFFICFFPCQNELKCVHTILAIFLHHLVSVLSLFSASNGIVWKVWGDEEKNSFERGFTSFHHKGKYSMGTFVVLWYWSNCPESSDLELC